MKTISATTTMRLLLLAIVVQYAFTIDLNDPSEAVQCFTGTSCDSHSLVGANGNQYIPAGDCCTGRGTFVKTTRPIGGNGNTCFQCITAGFNVSSLTISGGGTKHAVTVLLRAGDLSKISSLSLQMEVTASDASRSLSSILDLNRNPIPLSPFGFSEAKHYKEFIFEIRQFENRIGLEETADYTFSLALVSQPTFSAFHFGQKMLHLSVVDPDHVYVSFSQNLYTFSESSETAVVQLRRRGATASSFAVTVTCDQLFQEKSVIIPASLAVTEDISFSFSIPTNLRGNHTLKIRSVSDSRVSVISPSTSIAQIVNNINDVLYVGFQNKRYTFSESDTTASVTISLSHPIQQPLQLRIQGGPGTQPSTVGISGSSMNRVIEFTPGGSLTSTVSLGITDDVIGLESVEAYVLSLSLVGINNGVILGSASHNLHSTAFISIVDNEDTVVQMQKSSQDVIETENMVKICALLSNPVLTDIALTFSSTSITANDPNDYIGGSIRQLIPARQTSTCVSYRIVQDNIIEDDETFSVQVALSQIGFDRLTLGTPVTTTVRIIDANFKPVEPTCINEIDVMFILDSSGSVGEFNFTTMISFVSSVTERFEFGPDRAQFGVVTFSSSVSLDIPLGRHSTSSSFKIAIMGLPYMARMTNTAEAIEVARNELRSNGRAGIPKAIILFTDGRSDVPADTFSEALLAQRQGIRILTIGIGPKIDLNELSGVASDPNRDNVFLIESFSKDDFASILAPLVRETCEVLIGFSEPTYRVNEDEKFVEVSFEILNGTINRDISVQFSFTSGTATTNDDFKGVSRSYTLSPSQTRVTARFDIIDDTLPEQSEFFTASISTQDEFVKVAVPTTRITITDNDNHSCGGQIDLIVVIDSSGSIVPSDFERVKQFVSEFTSEFQIGSSEARFGIITFSNDASVNVELGAINDPNDFKQAITQIPFTPGRTNTAAAINLAHQQLIQNGRQGVPHGVVVITDGMSNDKDATIQAAVNAKANGIEIFAVGIGSSLDIDELNSVASDPDSIHVFLLSDFSLNSLSSILKPLAQKVCEPSCQRQIDFMLVIDSSNSVTPTDFNVLKQSLVDLVGQYEIGEQSALFGSVRYSSTASTVVSLGSVDNLRRELQSISYVGGTSNIANGIEVATQQLIATGRADVPKVMIVFTTGGSDDRTATEQAAAISRQSGVEIFAVGIGTSVSREELNEIARTSSRTFMVDGFNRLSFNSILSDIVRDTCSVPACSVPPLDIIFALDGSSSVGPSNFKSLLNFVVGITGEYNIDRATGTQFGIVVYSTTAQRVIPLSNNFQSRASLSNTIIDISFPGGGTSTHLALEEVRNEFSRNGRSQAHKVLILATDGQSNNPIATQSEAQLTQAEGIEIFSIGIGSGTNRNELNNIATDPDTRHVFTISNYTAQSFASISQSLTRGICRKPVTCNREADVIFIIDSSSGVKTFQNIKQFVIRVVSEIDISQLTTRVGVVQFSTNANLVVKLNDIIDSQSLISSIASLQYTPGVRNTHHAISLAHAEIREDGRAGVARIIYVITGGDSANVQSTIDASRIDGVSIIAIGVSDVELRSIASQSNLVFSLNDLQLSTLLSIRKDSVDIICNQEPDCQLDVMFVLDSSSAVASSDFQSFLEFMINVVNQYDTSTTQFGVISYSSRLSVSTPFGVNIGSISNKNELVQTISSLQQLGGSGRRTDIALREAYQQLRSFQSTNKNVVILLTTGISDDTSATIVSAQRLHSLENAEVFVIAVSDDNSNEFSNELFEISTKPSANHIFTLNSFQTFNSILTPLLIELCDDDSNIRADPMFIVPLLGSENTPSLCYEVYGAADKYFNLISDKCISVNAHYAEAIVSKSRPLHLIDQIGLKLVENTSMECVDVIIGLDLNQHHLIISVNGATVARQYSKGGIHVSGTPNGVFITATNCERGDVVIGIKRKRLHQTGTAFLELEIEDGLGITPSAHGLIGQFLNAPVKLSKERIEFRRKGENENDFQVIEFTRNDGSVKRVPAVLQSHTWGSDRSLCLYAGDSQGGPLYEVKQPNNSLLDGDYEDYITNNLLGTRYKYSLFNNSVCMF